MHSYSSAAPHRLNIAMVHAPLRWGLMGDYLDCQIELGQFNLRVLAAEEDEDSEVPQQSDELEMPHPLLMSLGDDLSHSFRHDNQQIAQYL